MNTLALPTKSAWWDATRAYSVTAVAAPCAAVALWGWHAHAAPHPFVALSAALGVCALLFGVNMANDVEDAARGIDGPGQLGGSGVLQARALSAAQLRRGARSLMGLGLLLGVPSALLAPRAMLLVGAVTAVGALAYSNRFFGLKYHALGDAAVFVLCGPLLAYGASVATFGFVVPRMLTVGCAFGFAAVAILHVNNWQDIAVDRAHGAFTVANVIGARASRWYLALLYVAAAIAIASLDLGALATALAFVGFIPAVRLVMRAWNADLQRYPTLRVQAAQAHLAIGASICAALITLTLRGVP